MQKLLLLILLFCLLLVSTSRLLAQDFNNPAEYLGYMNKEQTSISENMWSYISAVAHGKRARKIEKRREKLIATTREVQYKIRSMPSYKGDGSLRDSVVSYLQLNYSILNDDYAKIVDMEEIAEQSYDLMEALLTAKEQANDKLDKAAEMLNQQQKIFAEKHGIKLSEDRSKLTANLEKAGDVFKYYNQIYLIFFKSYKQEAYLMAALEKHDLSALEQNKNSLLKFSEEGLMKLDTIPRFKSDATLKIACTQLMAFYKMEAAEKFPIIMDFYLKKENFEKLSRTFENKKQSELTQEDVDQYNTAVSDYNQAIAQLNATNEQLNKLRGQTLDKWNSSVNNFMDKHTPK